MPAISLSTPQIFLIMVFIFIGLSFFQALKAQNKIYCTFIKRDGTEISKYAKLNQGRVEFENGYYNIIPNRITLKKVWFGVIPTKVVCAKWKWDSNMPIDPTTWKNDYDKPEDRAALDKTEDLRALFETQKNTLSTKSGKKSMLENLMPIIMIGGFLIVGYLVWKMNENVTSVGIQGNVTQQQLLDLMKALSK